MFPFKLEFAVESRVDTRACDKDEGFFSQNFIKTSKIELEKGSRLKAKCFFKQEFCETANS